MPVYLSLYVNVIFLSILLSFSLSFILFSHHYFVIWFANYINHVFYYRNIMYNIKHKGSVTHEWLPRLETKQEKKNMIKKKALDSFSWSDPSDNEHWKSLMTLLCLLNGKVTKLFCQSHAVRTSNDSDKLRKLSTSSLPPTDYQPGKMIRLDPGLSQRTEIEVKDNLEWPAIRLEDSPMIR